MRMWENHSCHLDILVLISVVELNVNGALLNVCVAFGRTCIPESVAAHTLMTFADTHMEKPVNDLCCEEPVTTYDVDDVASRRRARYAYFMHLCSTA